MNYDSLKTTTIQRLHVQRNRLLESIPRTNKYAALQSRRAMLAAIDTELADRAKPAPEPTPEPVRAPESWASMKARTFPSQMNTTRSGPHVMARVGPNNQPAAGSISFSHDAR